MEQMKNKNLVQENNLIKARLGELQQKLNEKVQRNIKLEGMMTKLEQ